MVPTAVPWTEPPRVLSEHLTPLAEPLTCLLAPTAVASPQAVARRAARALLDLAAGEPAKHPAWPAWLAPHQVPAAERLVGILTRYGGGLLADAVGLGKSYVALAVALALDKPFALVVPAVLVPQWRALLREHAVDASIVTHEWLSRSTDRASDCPTVRLFLVDEAHRFRNPQTRRYAALARLVVGARVLLVSATPVHNRAGDLCHLFRLFLRDHALSALGVPSLSAAARAAGDPRALRAAAARLCVARSRERVQAAYEPSHIPLVFPERVETRAVRVASTDDVRLQAIVAAIARLEAGGDAAALFRLLLLLRLDSSLAAFRESLSRYEAFLELAKAAAADGTMLGRRDFRRLFSAEQDELQLALFPLLLPRGVRAASEADRVLVARLRELSACASDPKADALAGLLEQSRDKTIVFTRARATVHHLMRRLRGYRVAAVTGERGWFGSEPARREEVLQAFAPRAQGARDPVAALETRVLLCTDLVSEGLNLQDAARVIHYDLPWSPARLQQRVGRIDRATSDHGRIEVVTFCPPRPLAQAISLERRLTAKQRAQNAAGGGGGGGGHGFDWCDQLYRLATGERSANTAASGCATAVAGHERAVVLVVRMSSLTEAVVVTDGGAYADAERATALLQQAANSDAIPIDSSAVERAIRRAAPLIRRRLAAIEDARWRAADRDHLSRRLIPWVLTAARRAARQCQQLELARLDGLVSRLAIGMTAGEEGLLDDVLARRSSLAMQDVLAWHERLPPLSADAGGTHVELVAVTSFQPGR